MKKLITASTSKSISDTSKALRKSVEANGLVLILVNTLTETIPKKGGNICQKQNTFVICLPEQAGRVLDMDLSDSTTLPRLITVSNMGAETVLSTIDPEACLTMSHMPHQQLVAEAIKETMGRVIDDVSDNKPLESNCADHHEPNPQYIIFVNPLTE